MSMSRLLLLLSVLLAAPVWAQPVFVANQGNFSEGDGSLTVLPDGLDGGAVQRFDGQLGSILQSATLLDQLYLVSNSANRIDVVDPETLQRTGQITGPFSSPRYLVDAGDGAYVSNQVYGGTSFVLPLDLVTGLASTPIEVAGLPEGMAPVGGQPNGDNRMYVALGAFGPGAGGVDSLAVISLRDNALVGYVEIGCYASAVVPADPGVMAFCADTDEAVVVSAQTDAVVQRIAFAAGLPSGVGQPVAYGGRALARRASAIPVDPFYVVTESGFAVVERTEVGWTVTREVTVPEADTRPISAIGVEQGGARRVILGRPAPDNPFTADGTVTVHDGTTGDLLATFAAGVYPAHIVTQDEAFLVATDGAAPGGADLSLALAGPHPARDRTALALRLDRAGDVRVEVFDVLGRPVARLADGPLGAGTHRVAVDTSALPAGTYLVRATADGRVSTVPLVVAR